jgi:hypothetical protein
VAEREASGDFDYLWDDPADAYGLTSHDQARQSRPVEDPAVPPNEPDDDQWDEPDDSFWENQPDPRDQGHFDAFNDDTWSFAPAPTPWYRTGPAVTAIIAASAAMVAIVVSGVLLVFRGPASTVDQVTSSVTPTAPTSAAPVQVASSEQPPPPAPPPPPPPSETQASQVNTAPGNNPVIESRPTKAPEIGVTRTPITRYPISVAPQPHGGRNGLLH